MSRITPSLARTVIAGLTVGASSVLVASPAGATPPPAAGAAPHPQMTRSTPMCLVGAAMFYPMFIGATLFSNPTGLTSALPAYWTGGKTDGKDKAPGDRSGGRGW